MSRREYETREPTGKPPWPITLLAGAEKSGKSWAAAEASGSDLIGRTFWISVGEDDPDEYKHVPGARFQIVKHDGTYRDILGATAWAARQPRDESGRPNLIVADSGSRLWAMLGDMGQMEANDRARRKAERQRKPFNPDEEIQIGRDLWNVATSRWQNVLDVLREHDGPSIITARLQEVSGTDQFGQPTKERVLKVAAQKDLTFDVGAVVEIHRRGEVYITGVRSVAYDVPIGDRKPVDWFTMDALWRKLGLDAPDATAPRQHAYTRPQGAPTAPETARPASDVDEPAPAAQEAAQRSPRPPADTPPADLESTDDGPTYSAEVVEFMAKLGRCHTAEHYRAAFKAAGRLGIRSTVIRDNDHGEITIGALVMKLGKAAPEAAPEEAAEPTPV